MILVTVGTNEQPFDRLVDAATRLGGPERLVVQHGSSRVAPGRGEWVAFLPFEEVSALMLEARVVVCHAGVGSMMLARRCGKRPIVVPRRLHLGEAVDDHQLALARRLDVASIVTLWEDARRLSEAVRTVGPNAAACAPGPAQDPARNGLAGELRRYLEGLVAA